MAKNVRRVYTPDVTARFDNAGMAPQFVEMFRNADSLAMTAALNPSVRKIVRERARYIVYNCPYGWSMLDTFVTHIVGPWASVSFPSASVSQNVRDEVADKFDAWAMESGLWPKVQTMIRAKVTDGEAFALFVTDKAIVSRRNKVSLNIRPIECDRVESYTEVVTRENEIDGIRFDENGHPTEYRVLKTHPGDYRQMKTMRGGEWVKARFVIHYFDVLRPEQVRGVSDFVAALDIPAHQKSYRQSVAETAINAASISGILTTDAVPECFDPTDGTPIGKCATDVQPNTVMRMARGSFITAPEGWKVNQLHAEQPTSLYHDFTRDLTAEMAACLSMPVNIAMCDSSQHNFASAKLDHMTYGDKIEKMRAALSVNVLDRIFLAWLEEYAAIYGLDQRTVDELSKTEWHFTERGSADVMKDASADNTRLGNGTTTRAKLYAKSGSDWKRETDQSLAEYAYIIKRWKEECAANGIDANTPCPILAGGGNTASPAPTEDMIEHDAQKTALTKKKGASNV